MPSSMVGLETVLGDDETVEFEDFLGGTSKIHITITVCCESKLSGQVIYKPDEVGSFS
jgi:hypothetical protein